MSKVIPILLFLLLTLVGNNISAQIQLQGNGKICLGDLAFFSYAPPSGKTVTAYDWDFGDTYTANTATPTYLYKKSGIVTATLKVTFSTGDFKEEEITLEILKVPVAHFDFIKTSDSCQYTNNICFTDKSVPGVAGQDIVSRAIVWGDGTQTVNNTPASKKTECHRYSTPDDFYVEMEVTDKLGCKSYIGRNIKILPSVQARISPTVNYPSCDSAIVCFRNYSIFTTTDKIDYQWTIDGKSSTKEHFYADPYCIELGASKNVVATLVATTKEGCLSQTTSTIVIEIEKGTRKIKTDSVVCYGQNTFKLVIDNLKDEKVNWYIDDVSVSTDPTYLYHFKDHELDPGTYTIKCILTRGACTQTLTQKIRLIGPVAKMKIFNNPQCGVNRRVYFVQSAKFLDTANATFTWYVSDSYGDPCVINRDKNINKYKNCNTTQGWFAKHDYTVPNRKNQVVLQITDTLTGCFDQIAENVDLERCGICQPFNGTIEICQNELFLPGGQKDENPVSFSLDSGKTWLPFPSVIGPEYAGLYRVGLVYKWPVEEWIEDYGDDSIRIHAYPKDIYDTFFVDDLLLVKKIKTDSVTIEFSPSCNPYEAVVNLKNGDFKKGETLWIWWGDGQSDYFDYDHDFDVKEVKHQYTVPGLTNTIRVELVSIEKCTTYFNKPFSFGLRARIEPKGKLCTGEEACFKGEVINFSTGEEWSKINGYGTISWLLDNKPIGTDDSKLCITLGKPQSHKLALISTSSSGCVDTTFYDFASQQVIAGIQDESKAHYCRGLRQFFDSSQLMIYNQGDYITNYKWDFGTGNFATLEKDPVQSFDGTYKQIQVKHIAISNRGCTDTTEFTLYVLTSKPNFTLDDSIGCVPLDVTFTNNSTGSTHFIWEFGDVNNSTFETSSFVPQKHQYKTPGTYYIYLIGIDSFYNTVNKTIYYCHTAYPQLGSKKVRVTVLPNDHRGFTGPDTLCRGADGVWTSLSDSIFDYDLWNMDDGSTYEITPGGSVIHRFDKDGKYTITLDPKLNGQSLFPKCMSKIEKEVVVLEIEADFDIDPDSKIPNYNFINYSKPKNANYSWDFGHPSSGSNNTSSIRHPSHNYGLDSGEHTICLIASSPAGCRDTVCKSIFNTFTQSLKTYNVFTPGNGDGVNDEFLIELVGSAYYNIAIYNRWGEVVFESKNANGTTTTPISWDGSINNSGNECPSGTYFYVLDYAYRTEPDKPFKVNGTVTLLRD